MNACAGALYQPTSEDNALASPSLDDIQQLNGYEAGEDSTYESDHSESRIGDGCGDSGLQELDDNIPMDEFQNHLWLGDDYDKGPRGIDDTDVYEDEVEVVGTDEVSDIDTTVVDNDIHGEVNPSSLLGDCGCATNELAQEISAQYLKSLKTGYKKRYMHKHVT